MNKNKTVYNCINAVILLLTVFFFIREFYGKDGLPGMGDVSAVVLLVVTVFLVHAIKACRLYLALYGNGLSFSEYLKTYAKVTPVSVILPFKLGEFFRMYCYGEKLGSFLKGIVIILFDRFMDTAALVTMIFLIRGLSGGRILYPVYFFVLFLVTALLIYLVFPGVYSFWKKWFLGAKATENKLRVLKLLEMLNRVYKEIRSVSAGRGAILYFMSVAAWAVELGSVALRTGLSGSSLAGDVLPDYLMCAMGSGKSELLTEFVFVSVVMMVALYVVIKILRLSPQDDRG